MTLPDFGATPTTAVEALDGAPLEWSETPSGIEVELPSPHAGPGPLVIALRRVGGAAGRLRGRAGWPYAPRMQLSAEGARVLGSLVEKELVTPSQYPLTIAALVAACNQSSNRDPVVSYDEGTVIATLDDLKGQRLVRFVLPSHGRSAVRYRHVLDETLALDGRQRAVLAVLLLRGPQTIGELRLRTDRMAAFDSLAEVEHELDYLGAREEPLVARLGRRPGQKEERWDCPLVAPSCRGVGRGPHSPTRSRGGARRVRRPGRRRAGRGRRPAGRAGGPALRGRQAAPRARRTARQSWRLSQATRFFHTPAGVRVGSPQPVRDRLGNTQIVHKRFHSKWANSARISTGCAPSLSQGPSLIVSGDR